MHAADTSPTDVLLKNYIEVEFQDENIHTPFTEVIGIFPGAWGSLRPKHLEKCMKLI